MKLTFPLIIGVLYAAEGVASAQVNLLPQGSFENPGVNTGWAEGFNIPNNQEFRVVSENGKRWLRIENRDPARQLDYVHAYVKVTPEIASLTVSARLRATNLKIGQEGWHTARVALMFEGGAFGFPPVVPELRADSDWVTKSVELTVPQGATRLNIQPALFRCTGVFEVADLTVTPRLAAPTQLADAVLPSGIRLGWDQTKVVTVNAKRAQVSLDGVWRFVPAASLGAGLPTSPKPPTEGLPDSRDLPVGSRAGSGDPRTAAVGSGAGSGDPCTAGSAGSGEPRTAGAPGTTGAADPPKLGWAYLKVPGDWQRHPNRRSDFLGVGGGPQWDLYDGARVDRAWYERQAPIPADWQGRTISLRFDRVCTDAIVFVNGKQCGTVAWPWGSVDITHAVTPGQTANLRVLVAAIADADQVGSFWQNAFSNVTYSAATLKTRGLTGSVFLESRASEARVTDVFVRTSTRKWEVSLDVELTGVRQAGRVRFVADMLNDKGDVEQRLTADAAVEATDVQRVTVSWPWNNPRLWDVDQPNLYTLRLSATGAGVDDQYNQEFGFREFWIDGRQFYLNGTETHLRQGCFIDGPPGQVGDNFSESGSANVDARGDASDSGPQLDVADHKGYLLAPYVLNANKYMVNPRGQVVWEENRQRALDRAAVWMRRYRNHPSAVMWVAGMNLFNNAVDADPRHIGRRDWDQTDERWQRLMAAGKEMFDGLKQLDPTRIYYSHAGAYTGDVYTMNCYLDVIPLQEREEWLSSWAADGEMPVSMVEFGTPMDCTFRRGRHGFDSNITSEPLLTEYAAIYLGTEAYRLEEPQYRRYLQGLSRSGMLYNSSENRLDEYANNQRIQQLFRVNTWRSWRTAGLPGGLRTWSWMQDSLKEVNGPTLAWIAGPAAAYTAKDHHFRSGQKVQKQIVLINDTRQRQDFTAAWSAAVGGQEVAKDQVQGVLAVSEIRLIPMQFTAPSQEAGSKTDGRITLSATIGQGQHQDAFAFRVFGQDQPARGEIAVVDPEGLTGKMLANLGYSTRSWNGQASALVVIGRNGLKANPALAASLEAYVQAGGRALICGQDPQWLSQSLGWRTCPHVSRRVFPIDSPLTGGIDAEDLRDWTGSSSLIEAYPVYQGDYLRGNERDQPYAGWHWGNRGGVSSAAIEKPHRSGWRPLLECEFDLAYTPLMELDYGQGRLLLCTLDLEDHVSPDPAARRVACRIMDYAAHARLSPPVQKVLYLGGEAGAAWLDKIGVRFQPSPTLQADAGLLLIGPAAGIDPAALHAYLEQGGRAFFLPQTQAEGPLGSRFEPAAAPFAGSMSAPTWPEARGLSASDLRWRCYLDTPPWLVSGGVEIGADGLVGRKLVGKGVAIFCQVDPDCLQADQKTYFRYTRWRSTRAVAQLLANLGATFPVDSLLFHPLEGDDAFPILDQPGPQARIPRPSGSAEPLGAEVPRYYHPDYIREFPMGDNPYRYYRW